MLKEQLKDIKEKKKTSDLYEEPLVYFADTTEMDAEGILDMIETEFEYFNLNIDRYMLNAKEEENFNRRFKTKIYELIKYAKNKDYKFILDFLIKQYRIDKMNKTELLFLILPFKEYEEQIAKLFSARTVSPNLISSKLHNEEILNLFKRYFEYQNLDYVYKYILDILDDYFQTHYNIKSYLAHILIRLVNSIKDDGLVKNYYRLIREKSELQFDDEQGSSHVEILEGKENVTIGNVEDKKEIKKRKVTFIDTMEEFKKNITEYNSDKILRDCSRPFVKENIEEILQILFKFSNINYSYIIDHVDDELIFKYVNEEKYLTHIINIASQKNIGLKDKFMENLNDEKIKYLLTYYEKINNKNYLLTSDLDIIEKYIIESQNRKIAYFYNKYILNLDNAEYNLRIENLVRHNKVAFVDTEKINDKIRNIIFVQPNSYFKNNLDEIIDIVKNDHRYSSIVYFKSKFDRIERNGLKEKLIAFLLNRIQETGNENYINILLCDDFIKILLGMLDNETAQLIYDAYILESTDYEFLFYLFTLSLDNSSYIKKSFNSFKILYNKLNQYNLIDFLTCERLRNYIYDVNTAVSCFIFEIYHSNDISLLLYINDIIPIIIDHKNVDLLSSMVIKYKNILLPFIKDIVLLIEDIEIISLLNVNKLICFLNGELLIKYLQNVEMTVKIISLLIKYNKINIRILYCIFYSKNISKILDNTDINTYINNYIKALTDDKIIDIFEDILSEHTVEFSTTYFSTILMNYNTIKQFLKYNKKEKIDFQNIYELYFMTAVKEVDYNFIYYLLKNADNIDFTKKVNQKLIDILYEKNKITLIVFLKALYRKYQYYNICIEYSLQHFKRLLEDDDEKIRRESNELIAVIKEFSNEKIFKMIYE